ncbi:MAG: ferritin-like domain-containing protein [Oscillatoria sp. PMC 1051.18]|nr:ferritin-like domain-containing protein [Oscillatoria sp. PMC 1050.18]MEC5032434.1 ferritin-like domain-containing protein [Oscillatoria sp. PMC 1051.18]
MRELDREKTIELLNEIMQFELAGVVRYTHYSLMVTGPNRIPIVQFFQEQATESLTHAQQVGEILTGLEGHPTQTIAPIEETFKHELEAILTESLNHERKALDLYKELLEVVHDASIYLEEFARGMIGQEELHNIEIKKMLRDFASS